MNEIIPNQKTAIISDIHGNYQVLKSVIEDIENKRIKNIICLGDIIGKGINSRKYPINKTLTTMLVFLIS